MTQQCYDDMACCDMDSTCILGLFVCMCVAIIVYMCYDTGMLRWYAMRTCDDDML